MYEPPGSSVQILLRTKTPLPSPLVFKVVVAVTSLSGWEVSPFKKGGCPTLYTSVPLVLVVLNTKEMSVLEDSHPTTSESRSFLRNPFLFFFRDENT